MKDRYYKLIDIQDKLKIYAIKLTGDIEDANDLLQETSMRIIIKISLYNEQQCFAAWAKSIMKHIYLNSIEGKRRIFLYDNLYIHDEELSVSEQYLSCDIHFHLLRTQLKDAIEKLPCRQKTMISMRLNGYKYTEIAEKTNTTIGNVKNCIFVAKNNLRNMLSD